MKGFPQHIGWDNWGTLMCDVALFSPLVSEALAAHCLPLAPIEAGYPGTHAVFRAGNFVVKLYAPLDISDEYAERRCYRAARGIPLIPKLYGEGVLHAGGYDWPYIILEHMAGTAVRDIWATMGAHARTEAMRALGTWAKAYHALPDPFSPASPLSTKGFVNNRRATATQTAVKLGHFGEMALHNFDALCARERPVLIHGDLTEDHLLIRNGKYAVIDLADSMMCFPQAEWICVWFELTRRDPDPFYAFLEASGRNWTVQARKDMMTAALLHRFGANILSDWSKRVDLSYEKLFPEV